MTRQEQAHTPGPWRLELYEKGCRAVIMGKRGDGNVRQSDGYGTLLDMSVAIWQDEARDTVRFAPMYPEFVANARLIAAAPDLLLALENLLTYDRVERPAFRAKPEGAPGSDARIRQDKLIALEDAARAAIAKASGERT